MADPPESTPLDGGNEGEPALTEADPFQAFQTAAVPTGALAKGDNERYLQAHPELKVMVSAFMKQALTLRPEDTRAFATEFFTSPTLEADVRQQMAERGMGVTNDWGEAPHEQRERHDPGGEAAAAAAEGSERGGKPRKHH